jgi:hypothetical protein
MKNICWKSMMVVSIFAMIAGFVLSMIGVYHNNYLFAYGGISLIIMTCISWWIWVMIVIKSMWDYTHSTVTNVQEIQQDISGVRQILQILKKNKKE